jgi:membrane protease subunit HflK
VIILDRRERTIFIAIIANFVLIVLRFFLARLSGSIGLVANAWHSFSDVFVSGVVLIGLIAARLGAKKLKNAVYKVENVLAVFVSVFIFYMGVEILSEALSADSVGLRYVPFAAAGAFIGVIINYFMARYKMYVGEQTGSQSLIADGCHSKMDMYCSIAVLVGLIGSLFGMKSLDKIAAIVAMVFLVVSGYEIFISNMMGLFGKACNHSGDPNDMPHYHFRGSKKMMTGIASILIAVYLISGIYIVRWNEVAIERRFGAVTKKNIASGLHYRFPFPFEEVTIIPKDTVQKIETGANELLTGDTNLINVNLSVHYKIEDAASYALNVNNLDTLVRAVTSASIREIVGSRQLDYLLTEGKIDVENQAKRMLQDAMNHNKTGISVVGVQVVEVSPPRAVVGSFQDLASARQDQAIYVNEAVAYRNTVIPEANGVAYRQIREAEGYKDEKIKTAEGDALLFTERQTAYADSKDVTRTRLYMAAMDKILANTRKILMGGNARINNADLWLSNNNAGGNQ